MMTELQTALATYNVPYWSEDYFKVSDYGHLQVHPSGAVPGPCIDVPELIAAIRTQGLALPTLVRFPSILHNRVQAIRGAFTKSIHKLEYNGQYQLLYPIKVNQQRRVVEEIIQGQLMAGQTVGLEAGSKPELLAVLALCEGHQATIVCNGYKDEHFIRLALMGEKLGHSVYLVIEKPSEVQKILQEAQRLGVQPRLGVRARLASIGKGHWQNTGGEKSKFGLTSSQLLDLVRILKESGNLACLQLLHFHLGSQIASIQDIQTGLRECGRFYVELARIGVPIGTVDIGGGLGVDYEGTGSRSGCSMNYDLEEYAHAVVQAFAQAAREANLPEPHIVSESGRALTAHHAILLANIIDVERVSENAVDAAWMTTSLDKIDEIGCLARLSAIIQKLQQGPTGGTAERNLIEFYHQIISLYQEGQTQFHYGKLSLNERAALECLYQQGCRLLLARLEYGVKRHHDILDELRVKVADKLFVNFSLFQSLPDVWGIGQIFPIMPVNHLLGPFTRRAIVQDITCDSDGRIDQYVDGEGLETTLPMPNWPPEQEMVLAFCMVGAYQEILGDMHNLFGDSNSVDVILDETGHWSLAHHIVGDSVAKVLRYVNFDVEQLQAAFERKLQTSALINETERALYLSELTGSFSAYTYLGC